MSARRLFLFFVIVTLATATANAQTRTITVQAKDTLWNIAQREGTDIATLKSLNGLTSDTIRVGMVLNVPGEAVATTPAQPVTVTVRAGDNLYDIALAYGVRVADLIAFNDLEGTVIHPGQQLQLLAGEKALEPLVIAVARGDSLWSIARSYDVTVAALTAANGITEASVLQPGHKLQIPGQYASIDSDRGGAVPEVIVVAKGDSLWALARSHNTTVAAIMGANNLTNERLISGQQLRILPGAEVAAGRAVPDSGVAASLPSGALHWPLVGAITSRFGYRSLRIGGSNFHSGLDLDGDTGDPIYAAAAGTVTHSGWQGGYGKLVIIDNGDNSYYYAHASEVLVSEGQYVEAGTVIALVGSTGNSTGSHLHFEIRVNGDSVDPLPILEANAQR
ncbi:MAG TPA: LysM peptidoglycan-binding domain-containing protein [Trueperaceae bacterium]|nr:LysM peptidoglycan-binding domain-containing protein [Trueperaceae bacterium]